MVSRLDFVLVVAAVSLGITRADFADNNNNPSYRVVRDSHVHVDPRQQLHRPVLLPGQYPRPLVLIPENYPQESLRPQRDLTKTADDSRFPRSISQQFPRPGPRPQPSPNFPRPPTTPTRFRREVDLSVLRHPQPYIPRYPPQTSPTFPRPEDIHGPVLTRVRRGGGRVSVDVEKNRGQKSTTRVTAEHNVYKSGDGRTRVDAGGYATNRGDRGGSINFSHRF